MLAPARGRLLERALASSPFSSASVVSLPSFLVPAFQTSTPARHFSATTVRPSKLGRTPISIPPGVEITIGEPTVKKDATTYLKIAKRTVTVAGPLGKLNLEIGPYFKVNLDPTARTVALSVQDIEIKQQREMWGTTWSYLNRYIRGVSEGHTTVLRLVGIGYRATIDTRPNKEEYPNQQFIILKLGFSHTVEMGVPLGVTASVPQPTRILLEGIDKEVMHSFAANIRKWRKPEPYKGKGIFVNDETIKLKQKKIK
ncbi:ribosomal protein L6, alpha-beta domain-containing protein [Lasiosphaeris hirsuta]|uniref:Ribosomal protein L6, alpha-beta domain-containing protein n=1 Tax=Lasiosphaeris hirsuta TaxID=260670 RepID=A0AA40A2Q4_9PEZI|nr:ribosomal protein L6, alpha-beta domain-containing protein [Lasiosphaeris hirsuta]